MVQGWHTNYITIEHHSVRDVTTAHASLVLSLTYLFVCTFCSVIVNKYNTIQCVYICVYMCVYFHIKLLKCIIKFIIIFVVKLLIFRCFLQNNLSWCIMMFIQTDIHKLFTHLQLSVNSYHCRYFSCEFTVSVIVNCAVKFYLFW